MKHQDVIERLKRFHNMSPDYVGCDEYKSGNPMDECRGIAVALVPTVEVIQKAVDLGCNLLITHEVIYYQTPDYPVWKGSFFNSVQSEKEQRIRESGITIWRDHDHMHFDKPDSIFTGVMKYLGWESYYIGKDEETLPLYFPFEIPQTTVKELAKFLEKKIGLNGIRYIGNDADVIKKVAFVAHLYPNGFFQDGIGADGYYHSYDMEIMQRMEQDGIQAILPGEIIEWTILSYIRDAAMLGKPMACFHLGHFNWEELGMKYAASYIREITDNRVPVHYIASGDMWRYV